MLICLSTMMDLSRQANEPLSTLHPGPTTSRATPSLMQLRLRRLLEIQKNPTHLGIFTSWLCRLKTK
jgi:hypothetical protein